MSLHLAHRLIRLVAGLLLYGIGIAGIVRGEIGASPWDVLTQGIARHTGLSFGLITVLVSGVVLLLWIPLRQRLGVGTMLNALLVGPAADLGLWLIPPDLPLWARIPVFAGGLLTLAFATGLYIGPGLGPGPRDGLMTGLNRRTGWPIWLVRTAIEGSVLLIGWVLGGNVGIGTLVFALLIGPLCGWTIPLLAMRPRAGAASGSVPAPDRATSPAPASASGLAPAPDSASEREEQPCSP